MKDSNYVNIYTGNFAIVQHIVMELNALGWNRFSFELNANSEKEREFLILDDSPYMLRFVEDGTNLVYPVYGDFNFNNLYNYKNILTSKYSCYR